MDPLVLRVARRFLGQDEELAQQTDEEHTAVAPPGWEGPVKEMKKDRDIDNPWALAWYMKNKGDKPHKKEGTLVERVAARHLRALAEEAAKKRTPKIKMPDLHKVKETLDKIVFAVKVLVQRKDDKGNQREVERLMHEYTDEVRVMGDALRKSIPETAQKDRERAQELFDRINFFTRPVTARAMITGGMTPEELERDFPKAMIMWKELEQLLGGQQVLFTAAADTVVDRDTFARFEQHHLKLIKLAMPIRKLIEQYGKLSRGAGKGGEERLHALAQKVLDGCKAVQTYGDQVVQAAEKLAERAKKAKGLDPVRGHDLKMMLTHIDQAKADLNKFDGMYDRAVQEFKSLRDQGYTPMSHEVNQIWLAMEDVNTQVGLVASAAKRLTGE